MVLAEENAKARSWHLYSTRATFGGSHCRGQFATAAVSCPTVSVETIVSSPIRTGFTFQRTPACEVLMLDAVGGRVTALNHLPVYST